MHLLTLREWDAKTILHVIDKAIEMKEKPIQKLLEGKTLAMLFQKTSTRTRVSFEAAMTQLGGHAMYLDWRTTNFTLGSLKDEIKCLSRYVDVIMARVYKHEDIKAMAEASTVPLINGLCDKYHPCQIMADLMTIKEKFDKFAGLKLAYVGDGNNVCNTLIVGCAKVGMKIGVACPKGYEPLQEVIEFAGNNLELNHDPKIAVEKADIIYTDTWISMGQEEETEKRLKIFKPYQINKELINETDALIMHCLPAHRGCEITDEVLDSKNSIVYDQAENRMHVQKAIILKLLGKI